MDFVEIAHRIYFTRIYAAVSQFQSPLNGLLVMALQQQNIPSNIVQLASQAHVITHRKISGCHIHNNIVTIGQGNNSQRQSDLKCHFCVQNLPNQFFVNLVAGEQEVKAHSSIYSLSQKQLENIQTQDLEMRRTDPEDTTLKYLLEKIIQKKTHKMQNQQPA